MNIVIVFEGRCYVFPVFGDCCEKCGCYKSYHSIQSHYRYVDKSEKYKVDNSYQIRQIRENFYRERNLMYEEYNRKISQKRIKENELNNLNGQKTILNNKKNEYINEKKAIDGNIDKMNKELTLTMLEFKKIYQNIKDVSMNFNHIQIENQYIESLINISDEIGDKTEQIKKLKESKKYNEIIEDIQKISIEELNKLGVDYLFENKIIKM